MSDETKGASPAEEPAPTEEVKEEEAGRIAGGIGTVDEQAPQNPSDGSGSGWWNDPNDNWLAAGRHTRRSDRRTQAVWIASGTPVSARWRSVDQH